MAVPRAEEFCLLKLETRVVCYLYAACCSQDEGGGAGADRAGAAGARTEDVWADMYSSEVRAVPVIPPRQPAYHT